MKFQRKEEWCREIRVNFRPIFRLSQKKILKICKKKGDLVYDCSDLNVSLENVRMKC